MPPTYSSYKEDLRETMDGAADQFYGAEHTLGVKAVFFRQGQRKADLDNLFKTVLDAGTHIFWLDDSQIREQYGRVIYGSTDPRVEIEIYELDGG